MVLTYTPGSQNTYPEVTRYIALPRPLHLYRSSRPHGSYPTQVSQHAQHSPRCPTTQWREYLTHALGEEYTGMANIHVLWRLGRLCTTQLRNDLFVQVWY